MILLFLQRYRVEKLLRESAAMLYINMRHPDVLGLEDYKEKYPHVVGLRVGAQLIPSAPVHLFEDVAVLDISLGGKPRQVVVPWQAILRSEGEMPPEGGGGGEKVARAA